MDLLASEVVVLEHLRNATTGVCPVVAIRAASFGEWTQWRRAEGKREAARRARFLRSLEAVGLSEAEFTTLQVQAAAYKASASEVGAMLADLAAAAQEGQDVAEQIKALEERSESQREQWQAVLDKSQRWLDAVSADESANETLDDVRHTFELVLRLVQRVDGVTAGGRPVLWDDAALAEMGLTKSALLERLLGAGQTAFSALYTLADAATRGLTDLEKKA